MDAFGFFALVASFAVFFEAGEFVGDTVGKELVNAWK